MAPAAREPPAWASASALPLRIAGAALHERLRQEWRATPLHDALISRPRATGPGVRPRDLRPARPGLGAAVLEGRFPLSGVELDVGLGGDPWNQPSPSRAFAVQLHRFAWLSSLLAEGDAGGREGLRLVLAWRRLFDRPAPFAWGAEVLERRVFNLACGLGPFAAAASEREIGLLAQSLARQARHLLSAGGRPARRAERLTAVAVAGAALAGATGARLLSEASRRLGPALDEAVLPDGGVKTRSPEQAMELLFDLMTLDDALVQLGREAPAGVSRALDRLGGAVRVFALPDGRLASFNGGGFSETERVAAALAYDESAGRPYDHAPHSGYHRLQAPGLTVLADAAGPPPPGWDEAACAQPLAIEVIAGRERLICGSGWTPDSAAPAALRLSAAASTVTLGDLSPGRPRTGAVAAALGAGLVGAARHVEAERDEDAAAIWLELAHDGWAEPLGLVHGRRLFLDPIAGELRGEDRFAPAPGGRPRPATAYAVRFHLPPPVRATLARDGRSVLLRGASDRGWWLRNDATNVTVEDSVVVENEVARRSSQVVLRGVAGADETRVRWKLTPVEPPSAGTRP